MLAICRFYRTGFIFLLSVFLLALSSCDSSKVVVHGVEEKEANEILVFLASKNISADKVLPESSGGGGPGDKTVLYDIAVSENEWINAMAILNREGLPRKKGTNLLQLFSKSGLVPSEQEENIRYRAGKEEELASTIRKIDGVIDADIQLSLPEEQNLVPGTPSQIATASVYVKHQGILDDPNSHLITKIKRLVASSVPGLEFDNVTVIADRSRFTDVAMDEFLKRTEAQEGKKEYVKVWSVVIAKESASRFRMIFLTFCLTILFFVLGIAWLLWKVHPLAEDFGGLGAFFTLEPFRLSALEKDSSEATEEGKDTEEESLEEEIEGSNLEESEEFEEEEFEEEK